MTRSGRVIKKPSALDQYRDDEESKLILGKRESKDELSSNSDDYIENHINKQQRQDNQERIRNNDFVQEHNS